MPAADLRTATAPRPRRKPTPAVTDPALAEKALAVHARLCPVYGCPIPYFHSLDPVSELVSSLLSHRTRNAESGRAFKALRARFRDWEAVIDADVPEIEAAIAGVTWPELKAPRIRDVLRALRDRCGGLDLAFLADMEVEAARVWLQAIPGVGPKTSAAVLSFSTLRMPALPVDSHHHRVAQRLGLIGKTVDVGPSHPILRAQLPADWSAQDLYDNHEILMLHGQKVCHHRRPACGRCVLVDLCPSARLPTREP
ncbi:endonuclease III domain-containing protein [Methylobacterium radiotolerans]|uniref:Helix-hairpin-helix motif protein n=1 Tax=Methylobacterium radiotolerans (strain ATCC 27329 / DSM 1819 / JCM 2831 / NBRC 15690 / NCIMB 10815 / 0-1) TaxID=426355 RepID=B1LY96_METRJ|nr:(Fe-S)-cluster assembly protein [Methylobacterium radiotolerans]ACB27280.1 helix-hairpin-helix motif protein [Methylobacterium radiotolerans JCM 2831]GEM98223.1 endonuclease III [Methylobacterium radiotolerans]